jgi:hypothetical protein
MAFSTHDQVPDSPTNVFATLNVLDAESATLSNGNLAATINTGPNNSTTIIPSSGTWYWEVYITDHTNIYIGIQKIETQESGYSQDAVAVNNVGNVYYDASYQNKDALPSIATGDIISVFWDIDNKKIWFAQNGQFYDATGTTHPTLTLAQVASGVNGYDYSSNIPNSAKPFFGSSATSAGIICNFGQDSSFGGNKTSGSANATDSGGIGDFYHSVPSDAKALCTANLPDPDIDPAVDDLPEDYMKAVLYTGNGTTQSITSVGFQPDLVWIKERNDSSSHQWFDSVRGATKRIESDNTSYESTISGVTSFNSSGFSLGSHTASNQSSINHVAWCFRAGGSPSGSTSTTGSAKRINSSGTQDDTSCSALATAATSAGASNVITPTLMSINQKSGFSIVKYSGNSTSGATIPHGLISAPEFVIIKNLTDSVSAKWGVFHKDSISSGVLYLDDTAAAASADTNVFNSLNASTISTINTITIGNYNGANGNGDEHIMYCWHSVSGYSAFGSYTGNGSTDGPFVYTGFKPAWVMVKMTSNGFTYSSWVIYDNARKPYNPTALPLHANSSVEEGKRSNGDALTESNSAIDFLSNGFKIKNNFTESNRSADTFIYAAFAEMPFRYSATNAR